MKMLPLAKNIDFVVQDLDQEVLLYNLNTHQAYSLNPTSSVIYRACDGQTSFEELKQEHKLTDEIIYLALDGLKKENLLAGEYVSPFGGKNRREVIRNVGLASMIALPVISSLLAPTSAMAASCIASGQTSAGTGSAPSVCIANVYSRCCSGNASSVSGNWSGGGGCTCSGTCL